MFYDNPNGQISGKQNSAVDFYPSTALQTVYFEENKTRQTEEQTRENATARGHPGSPRPKQELHIGLGGLQTGPRPDRPIYGERSFSQMKGIPCLQHRVTQQGIILTLKWPRTPPIPLTFCHDSEIHGHWWCTIFAWIFHKMGEFSFPKFTSVWADNTLSNFPAPTHQNGS